MNTKKLTIMATLACAATLVSHASTANPNAAFDSCVQAFTNTYLPKHPVRQVRTSAPQYPTTLTLAAPRKYTIALSARGVQSNAVLAEARCVANENGIVLILDKPPLLSYLSQADFVATVR
jgi:hypothetical protein